MSWLSQVVTTTGRHLRFAVKSSAERDEWVGAITMQVLVPSLLDDAVVASHHRQSLFNRSDCLKSIHLPTTVFALYSTLMPSRLHWYGCSWRQHVLPVVGRVAPAMEKEGPSSQRVRAVASNAVAPRAVLDWGPAARVSPRAAPKTAASRMLGQSIGDAGGGRSQII